MAQTISRKLNIANKSTDDIFIDLDRAQSYIKTIKSDLTDLTNSLKRIKKAYVELRDNPKTKGKFKKTVSKMANGAANKVNKTNALKNSLEASMLKSIAAYSQAMSAFDELDADADSLGTE